MQALEPQEEFSYEDIIPTLCVTPHVKENGITIVIVDVFVGRIVNEKGVVCGRGINPTRIGKQSIEKNFQVVHFVTVIKEFFGSDLYLSALLLI